MKGVPRIYQMNHIFNLFPFFSTITLSFIFNQFITTKRDKVLLKYILISLDFPLNSITSITTLDATMA